MMATIIVEAEIDHDKHIIAKLPNDIYVGRVKLTIEPLDVPESEPETLTLEMARAKLLAAGSLAVDLDIPDDLVPLTEEELDELGRSLPPGRSSDDLINEDRGDY